jgi:serine phosphatase RsbU (regulator of sigma subunit)
MDSEKDRPTLKRRLLLAVGLVLVTVLGAFMFWDYSRTWRSLIEEKRIALEEEAKVLLKSIYRLKQDGNLGLQAYIDEVCGTMQETTSPGHHIVVEIGPDIFQAEAHHRASPEILSAMKGAATQSDGLAPLEKKAIVVGVAGNNDITVYVSEYLSNLRAIVKAQLLSRAASILLLGLVLAIVLNVLLNRVVLRPLNAMVGVIRRFGRGQLGARMPCSPTKELSLLAQEFDRMAVTIERAECDRRGRMEKARQIQRHLLPNPSKIRELNFACIFQPAADVAGDYYDIVRFSNGAYLFCVADVVGHDVPAAMSAAMLKALLKTAAEQENQPQKIIYLVHSAFSEVTLIGDFATMFLASWSPAKEALTYVNAGHEPGYLLDSKGRIRQLGVTGPILGLEDLSEWSQHEVRVHSGDRLIMLTDGIVETLSPEGKEFGRERLIEILKQNCSEPLNTWPQTIMSEISTFSGKDRQRDDLTMLAIEL